MHWRMKVALDAVDADPDIALGVERHALGAQDPVAVQEYEPCESDGETRPRRGRLRTNRDAANVVKVRAASAVWASARSRLVTMMASAAVIWARVRRLVVDGTHHAHHGAGPKAAAQRDVYAQRLQDGQGLGQSRRIDHDAAQRSGE